MNSSSSLQTREENKYTSKQQSSTCKAAFTNLLKAVTFDTELVKNLVSEFSVFWQVHEFKLGDELTSYNSNQENKDSKKFLYLICSGRVRLLGFDKSVGREVSSQLLLADETFGSDDLFCNHTLPYRAIAACDGAIVRISVERLKKLWQCLPNLKNYLQTKTLERQKLIFLKTSTELRSQTSYALQKILPYLVLTNISAGSSLAEVTSQQEGRFWLVEGKVDQTTETSPPEIGQSWGYPDGTPITWTAQTDLSVYYLPKKDWELVHNQPQEITPTIEAQPENLVVKDPHSPKPDTWINLLQNLGSKLQWLLPRYPFICQQSSSDCGAACLAMVSQYWGKRFRLNTLRQLAQVNCIGASLEGLTQAAKTLGYEALPVEASLDQLESLSSPWIAHWQGIHYVVVWEIKGEWFLISDPAIGKYQVPRQEFEANWTKYAIVLTPTDSFYSQNSEKLSLNLYSIICNYSYLLGQILVISVLMQVFGLATPLLTQIVLDSILLHSNIVNVNIFAIGFLLFGVYRLITRAVRQYLLDYFSNSMDLELIGNFVNDALHLPVQFFISHSVRDIITQTQENRKIQHFLTRKATVGILDAVMAIIYLSLMTYYNLQLTLIVVSFLIPVMVLSLATTGSFLKRLSRQLSKESAAQNSFMVEIFTGIATVKATDGEKSLFDHWHKGFSNMLKTRFRGQKAVNNLQFGISLINHLSKTTVLWCGVNLVITQQMTVGQLIAFNMLIPHAINPILALLELWDEFQEVLLSVEKLADIFESRKEEPRKPLLVLPPLHGDVEFENVTSSYHQGNELNSLKDLSFQVKAGQCVGIVGNKDSEKNILINLLTGLCLPDTGRVLLDGRDTRDISAASLQSQCRVVPQECFLFSGTILENITLYSSDFNEQQVQIVASITGLDSFIKALPLRYNTRVREEETLFSSEQKKRIALARTLIRNPRIIVLDEATIYSNAVLRFPGCTTFVFSNSFATLGQTDYILFFDRGILVEKGTHKELMAINGLYYNFTRR